MEGGIGVRTPRQAIRILALLVESGMIYILIGVSSASEFKHVVTISFQKNSQGRERNLCHHYHAPRARRYYVRIQSRERASYST